MIIDISNHMQNMHISRVSCFRTWKRVLHITTGILLLQSLDVFHPCPICPGVKNGSLVRGYGRGKLFGRFMNIMQSGLFVSDHSYSTLSSSSAGLTGASKKQGKSANDEGMKAEHCAV